LKLESVKDCSFWSSRVKFLALSPTLGLFSIFLSSLLCGF
jgi:hypothetical protein